MVFRSNNRIMLLFLYFSLFAGPFVQSALVTDFTAGGILYRFLGTTKSYAEAEKICRQSGANVAKFTWDIFLQHVPLINFISEILVTQTPCIWTTMMLKNTGDARTTSFVHDLLDYGLDHPTKRSRALPSITQLLVALRFYARGSFLSETADVHGISRPTASKCISAVTSAICNTLQRIKFPSSPEDILRTKLGFFDMAGFQNVLGVVDGSLIPIQAPSIDEPAFVCRKGYHAINIQAVVDAQMRCLHKSGGCLLFKPTKCCKVILATCPLHNMCVDKNIPVPELIVDDDNDNDQQTYNGTLDDDKTVQTRLIETRFTV